MFLKFIKNRKFIILSTLIILVAIGCVGITWHRQKMFLVGQGLAKSSFPFREYNLLELARQGKATDDSLALEKLVANLPTRVTPKKTLDNYIQALDDYDIEKVLDCFSKKQFEQKRLREFFHETEEIKSTMNKMARISKEIRIKTGLVIKNIKEGDKKLTTASYKYLCEIKNTFCLISFEKDFYGNWKITKLY